MMSQDYPPTIAELTTPCFLVDILRAKLNASRMLERCENLGVQLRPHMKTHKTVELALLQTGGNKSRIVVSTLKEAEFYATNGFDDILYGCPITAHHIPRCTKLAVSRQLHLLYDSHEAISALHNSPVGDGRAWSVFLAVDTGNDREGALWNSDEAVQLAKEAAESEHISFQGIYSHDGHSYRCRGVDEVKKLAEETANKMLFLKNRLLKEGIDCVTTGVGSTPSCINPPDVFSSLSVFHPGNYIFFDYNQQFMQVCGFEEIACRVATRVISHSATGDHLLVDCGFLGLSHDGIAIQQQLPYGFCAFQDQPNLRMVRMTQELGKVEDVNGKVDFEKYPIGKILYIYPWHSCATAAMYSEYFVHEGDAVVGVYKPTRGW
ncbi:D-threo-3-hydroxyaspartate dehydratase-like [Gigantopelta aegis]|uniref:D-threo-3-hydroxyaspartate dehydratase-like n=1 Tax=Gigantopelta aegis TaxID=1735272 RepID=UPI001B888F9F|nr:D-threo-3-hydroxyaspartate dehydratase-like [Gigantopelta aegis]